MKKIISNKADAKSKTAVKEEKKKKVVLKKNSSSKKKAAPQKISGLTKKYKTDPIFERITDAFFAIDKNWCCIYMNKRAGELRRCDPDKMIGKHLWTVYPGCVDLPFYKAYHQAMSEQKYIYLEEYYPPYDLWLESHIYPSPEGLSVYFRDISERKNAEEKISRANRLYNFISHINQTIIKSSNEKTLFKAACDIAVNIGKFRMAWIGLIDETSKKVVPIVHSGEELSYLSNIPIISVAEVPEGKGPTGTALREGKYIVCNDIANDPMMELWKEEAMKRGYLSSISLPIKKAGKIIGVFSLFAGEKNYFDASEIDLLKETTNDIAFALEYLEKETERKLAEEKLKNTSLNLSIAQAIAHIGSWELDFKTKMSVWSDEACSIYGLAPSNNTHSYDTWFSFIHPDDKEEVSKLVNQSIDKLIPVSINHRIVRKDGSIRHILSESIIKFNADGKPIGMNGIAHDITDRKIAEDALLEKEQLLSESQKIAHIGSWTYNFDGQIVWSEETYRIFQVSPQSFIPTKESFLNLIHPDDRVVMQDWINKTLAGEKPEQSVFRRVLANSNYQYLDGKGEMKYDKNNNPLHITGTVQDITASRLAEKALRKSENKYRNVVENIHEALIMDDKDGRIIYANSEFCKMFGFTSEEITKISIRDYTSDESYNEVIERHLKRLSGIQVAEEFIYKGKRKDGTEIWVEARVSPVMEKEKIVGTQSLERDITQKILAQENLKSTVSLLSATLESTTDGILVVDKDGVMLKWNQKFADMWKQSDEMLASRDDEAVINNILVQLSNPEKFIDKVKHLYSHPEQSSFDQIDFLDGRIFERYSQPQKIGNEIAGRVWSFRDITEWKKADRKIKESEARYRSLIEQASDAINLTDLNGNFIDVNDSMCKMVGYSKEELIGKNASSIMDPEQLKERPFNLELEKAGKQVFNERRFIHKNGTAIDIEANVKKINSDLVLAIVRDITERKKTEKALLESENRLRTIIQSEPECVKTLNAKSELLDINPAGLVMIEADNVNQVIGKCILNIVNEKYRSAYSQLTKDIFDGKTGTLEFEITGLKGTKHWLATHAVPMKDVDGNIISLLAITRDITDRITTEKKIINTNEQLRRLTNHLQSIREEERIHIAHEIHDELGQQLTIVKMNIFSLLKKHKNLGDEFNEQAAAIGESINRTVNTVRKIASELRPVILDEQGLNDSLRWQSNEFSKRTGIVCKLTIEEYEPIDDININTQFFRIYQEALTNIVRHANATRVDATMKTERGILKLMISDNGGGFNTERISEKKSLGLVMMRERALSIGATLNIRSESGQGTSILFSLPLNVNV